MYCGHGLPLLCALARRRRLLQATARGARMYTRAKTQIAAGDRARHQNVPDTSGITAVELKIEGLNLWRMPIDTIREIRYSTDI